MKLIYHPKELTFKDLFRKHGLNPSDETTLFLLPGVSVVQEIEDYCSGEGGMGKKPAHVQRTVGLRKRGIPEPEKEKDIANPGLVRNQKSGGIGLGEPSRSSGNSRRTGIFSTPRLPLFQNLSKARSPRRNLPGPPGESRRAVFEGNSRT